MRVLYKYEDPFTGRHTEEYRSARSFLKSYPMYKQFLSEGREKHELEIRITSYVCPSVSTITLTKEFKKGQYPDLTLPTI